MKVLIAEDDAVSRTALEAFLRKWQYTVISTNDGNEAWQAMQAPGAPQLAILDWMMPGLDGLTLIKRLRGQERSEPLYLILLTAKTARGDVVEALESGADDYITKPYDRAELRARINVGRRMLELQARLREREKLQGVLEMAGAVCHELNQPLQTVSGFSELLLMDLDEADPRYDKLTRIKSGIDQIAALTGKIMRITRYRAKSYLGSASIVDIDQASS